MRWLGARDAIRQGGKDIAKFVFLVSADGKQMTREGDLSGNRKIREVQPSVARSMSPTRPPGGRMGGQTDRINVRSARAALANGDSACAYAGRWSLPDGAWSVRSAKRGRYSGAGALPSSSPVHSRSFVWTYAVAQKEHEAVCGTAAPIQEGVATIVLCIADGISFGRQNIPHTAIVGNLH